MNLLIKYHIRKNCLFNCNLRSLKHQQCYSLFPLISKESFQRYLRQATRLLFKKYTLYEAHHGPIGYYGTLIKQKKTFKLSDIGEGISEVQILEWHVSEGSHVKEFDKLATVQSDKATVELTSPYEGTVVKIYSEIGKSVKVGDGLVDIEVNNEETEDERSTSLKITNERSGGGNKTPSKTKQEVLTIPKVRKLAQDHGIDLSKVNGTGTHGRVLLNDIEPLLSSTKTQGQSHSYETTERKDQDKKDALVPLNGIQKAMLRNMKESAHIPQFHYSESIRAKSLLKLHEDLKEQSMDIKISLLVLFIKITSIALKDFPLLNGKLVDNEDSVLFSSNHHIGVAVDTTHGLTVPVIKSVHEKSILDIAVSLKSLIDGAKKNTLSKEEFDSDARVSLSNIGTIGEGFFATPLLVKGQSLIGAFTKIRKMPLVIASSDAADSNSLDIEGLSLSEILAVEPILNVHWTADHRIIDGAMLARFSSRWKCIAESPSPLLLLNS